MIYRNASRDANEMGSCHVVTEKLLSLCGTIHAIKLFWTISLLACELWHSASVSKTTYAGQHQYHLFHNTRICTIYQPCICYGTHMEKIWNIQLYNIVFYHRTITLYVLYWRYMCKFSLVSEAHIDTTYRSTCGRFAFIDWRFDFIGCIFDLLDLYCFSDEIEQGHLLIDGA